MATIVDPDLTMTFERERRQTTEMKPPRMMYYALTFLFLLGSAGVAIGILAYKEADDADRVIERVIVSDENKGGIQDGDTVSSLEVDQLSCPQTVSIPEGAHVGTEFEVSVNSNGGWLGESVGNTKLGFRQRRRDESTDKFIIPRSIRRFVENGKVNFMGEMVDPGLMHMDDLKMYMREVVDLPPGIMDPFDDTRRFDVAGDLCECETALTCDCKMLQEDMFIDHSSTLTDYTNEYFSSELRLIAGEEGYQGRVKKIDFHETKYDHFEQNLLANEYDKVSGEPGFRLMNDEVDAVFFLEGKKQRNFEVLPGRSTEIWGWRGGKVEDFEFDEEGNLVGGFVVVGPHPDTDPNDRVVFGEKRYGAYGYHYNPPMDGNVLAEDDSPFSDLEVRSPGPELRFVDGQRNRIFVHNRMEDDHEEKISVHWHGFDLPHDQDGVTFETQTPISVNQTYVYEFQTPNVGSRWYHQHYNTPITMSFGMFGPSTSEYPDEVTTWDREYVTQVSDAVGRFLMNGNVFPGTIERLAGYFKDVMRIESSEPAEDGSGDTIVTIIDEKRADLIVDTNHPPQASPNPYDGAPIRPGTGGVDEQGNHVHGGHNIPNRIPTQGKRVQILGHQEPSLAYPQATVNGYHYVTAFGDSSNLKLRVPKVGSAGTPGGQGGAVYVWRKHKSSLEDATLQNNGVSGAHFKFNYGEELMMRWLNAAITPHPLHIHGHQWNIIAVDGNLLDSPIVHNVYMVPQAGTFDAKVNCNNPNRFGGWMIHCHNLAHLANGDNPFPRGAAYPGGMLSHLDYTGFDRKKAVVSDHFHTVHFNALPPTCKAMENVVVGRDVLGWVAPDATTHLDITGEFDYGTNTVTKAPFGEILDQHWEVGVTPSVGEGEGEVAPAPMIGSTKHVIMSDMTTQGMHDVGGDGTPFSSLPINARVMMETNPAEGNYTFLLTVEGANAARFNDDDVVECHDELTVTVTSEIVDNQGRPEITMHSSPDNVRLVPGDDRGHITYPMFRGTLKETEPLLVAGAPTVTVPSASGDGSLETIDVNGEFEPVDVLGEEAKVYMRASDGLKVARVMRDPKIMLHGRPVDVDVEAGESGSVDYRMLKGKLAQEGEVARDVFFVVTDASDEEVAEAFGAIYAPTLAEAETETLEDDVEVPDLVIGANYETSLVFKHDAGLVARLVPAEDSGSVGPVGNPDYSPMKRFMYKDRVVTINAPFVKWGEEDGQEILIDEGGCDPRIRKNLPSPVWFGGGPPGCFEGEEAIARYKGGQALEINYTTMVLTMKAHRGFLRDNGIHPYYVVFDAGRPPPSGYMGTPYAAKLEKMGRGIDTISSKGLVGKKKNAAVATLYQHANGVLQTEGGPNRFQSGVVPFSAASGTYTPMWHIAWLVWNCGFIELGGGMKKKFDDITASDETEWLPGANVEQMDMPGNGMANFSMDDPEWFDPFQLNNNMKDMDCPAFVARHTGPSGKIFLNDWVPLVEEGHMFITDSPPGAELGGTQLPLVMNCPMPITVDMGKETPEHGLFLHDEPTFSWRIVRMEDDEILFTHDGADEELVTPPSDGWKPVDTMATAAGMSVEMETAGSQAAREVYFAITDASNEAFAKAVGATYAPLLAQSPSAAVELGTRFMLPEEFDVTNVEHRDLSHYAHFNQDPGLLRTVEGGELEVNQEYSPLKRFLWEGEVVTISAPMIKWGEGAGQSQWIDEGGCDPLIAGGVPGEGGPPMCHEHEHPLDRRMGSQMLMFDVEGMRTTRKLHKMAMAVPGVFSYHTVWEYSDVAASKASSSPVAPKLAHHGRFMATVTQEGVETPKVSDAVGLIRVPMNGVWAPTQGVGRFGLPVSLGADPVGDEVYTPVTHVTFTTYNCEGAIPAGEVPTVQEGRELLLMMMCPDYVANVTGIEIGGEEEDGVVLWDDLQGLLDEGKAFEFDGPPLSELGGESFILAINSVPLTVDVTAVAPVAVGGGGPVGPGRDIHLFGTDNVQSWLVSIDGEAEFALEPFSAEAVDSGSVGTVDVHAGDTVWFSVETSSTGHGVVFAGELVKHTGTAEDEVREILDVDEDASAELTTSNDFKFLDLFEVEGFGAAVSAVGPNLTLIKGTVKPGQAGKSLVFTCFVHGTATMNGRLRVTA